MSKSTSNKKNVVDHSTLDVKGNLHIGDVTYIINEKKVTIPHLLTNNIPSNAERILGRDKELATIATHLAHNLPTVLVNGIGGIGKTSVAAKYVATFGHTYKHLAWLTVQSSLLIELVAKAVENAGFSFQELQTMVETQFIHDENLNEDIVPTGKHGDNYAAKRAKIEEYIWLIFKNLKDLGDDAKQILRGMAKQWLIHALADAPLLRVPPKFQ